MNNLPENTPKTPDTPLSTAMFAVAAIIMVFVKPAQYLRDVVYRGGFAPVRWLIGLALSATVAVKTGASLFYMGLVWWLPLGIASAVGTYVYIWPLLYLVIFRWSFELSSFLWRRVPSAKEDTNEFGVSSWFSKLLLALSFIAVSLFSLSLWFSLTMALRTAIGWTGLLAGGAAWIISAVICGLAAAMVLALGFAVLDFGMPVVAIASAGWLAYANSAWIVLLTQDRFGVPVSLWFVQSLVFLLGSAYVFPALHLFASVFLRRAAEFLGRSLMLALDNYNLLLASVFNEDDSQYRLLTRHLINIALAVFALASLLSHATLSGLSIFTDLYFFGVIVLAVLLYIIFGNLLRFVANSCIAFVWSLLAGYFVFGVASSGFTANSISFGINSAVFTSAPIEVWSLSFFTIVATFFVAYPLAYAAIRAVAGPLLANWLAEPLDRLHTTLSRELFDSFSNTYGDQSEYGLLFAHASGIVASCLCYLGMSKLLVFLGFTGVGLLLTPAVFALAIYLAAGKLFSAYGNPLLGVLISVAAGVFVGVESYLNFAGNIWFGLAGFLIFLAATWLILFPLSYVFLRALLNTLSVTAWALPVVKGGHDFLFSFVARFWSGVVAAYRAIEALWLPFWRKLSELWGANWRAAEQRLEDFLGRRK